MAVELFNPVKFNTEVALTVLLEPVEFAILVEFVEFVAFAELFKEEVLSELVELFIQAVTRFRETSSICMPWLSTSSPVY